MKSIKTDIENEKESPFPKLMVSQNGNVVLMISVGQGTLVFSVIGLDIGLFSTWTSNSFVDFSGTITLSNT